MRKQRSENLEERVLEYLHEERANLLLDIKRTDALAVEQRKRLRQLDREIGIIRGGAL